ncbi:alcohol dehydrogenase [candidate division WOR-3 bacterium 4484_100]|uniref:alcohol dehydrogenase n=1 Tax=candidate division WOR-3 bacterium 4484_100 TaxID=1936077 RepID=A0A1V4QFP6_UNCW3|nr:MAG: alcohol dehydrogenase [candidate division WOR-3 bacterium 4484_100]
MKAMILEKITQLKDNPEPLRLVELPIPEPGQGEVLLKVLACGVCHTELDEIEGRTPPSELPRVLGHEVVGRVEKLGPGAERFRIGDRVGVAWFYSSCGRCEFCKRGNENLCPEFRATGRDADGGYAEFMKVPEQSAYSIPDIFTDLEAAPLLCAGVVGYRALKLTGLCDGETIGLFGFGASAHIIIQVIKYKFPQCRVYVFTRPGQTEHQNLAKRLGADWVGATGENPPDKLHRAIDFTPAWNPVVQGMRILRPGGRLVINAIRKEPRDKERLLDLDYGTDIWCEKELKSTANVTRKDAQDFLPLAAEIPIRPEVQVFSLQDANRALILLKQGKIQGAGVLKI